MATIDWVAKNTNIPVPTVLFCDLSGNGTVDIHNRGPEDDERETFVGAPYMLMRKVGVKTVATEMVKLNQFEQIPGRTLERMWPDMSESQRETVVRTLAGYVNELLQTRFSSIGSLYASDGGTDVGPMIPICNPWCFRTDTTLDSGPWATEKEYLLGCIEREVQWISGHPEDLYSTWSCNSNSDLVEQYTAEAVLTHSCHNP